LAQTESDGDTSAAIAKSPNYNSEQGAKTMSLSPETVTDQGSGLVFNNTYGPGVSTAFRNEIIAAENYLQSQFGNACTVSCNFDLQSINRNYSGENSFNPIYVSYSTFVNALQQHATTATALAAAAALSNLPDPSHGALFEVPIGEARILGLAGAGSGTDDNIVLNSYYWTASALQSDPGDAEAVLEHELSEGIMGRIGSLGIADPGYWAPMDLFRFTASGQRDFTGGKDGQPTYFSVNGSNVYTGLQFHNSVNSLGQFDGFDLADWNQVGADSNARDPFGPGGPGAGDPGTLSATDITILEALGWAPPTSRIPPTVQAVSSISVAENQSIAATSLISSISNPSGDSITLEIFKDDGGGSGYFTVNGVRQPDGQWIIPSSSSDNIQYVGGSSPGTDTLEVGIYDYTTNQYYTSSTTTSATTTTPHVPPSVYAVSIVSLSENQPIAASSLIASISNPSGDSITLEIFKDDGGGTGYFTVNGVHQPDGQWIIPTSSSDNVQYVGGSSPGTDTLEVGIYDYTTNQYYTSSTTVSATTEPAIVTGYNFSVHPNQQVAISSYFSLSNPSGDDVAQYAFFDQGGGRGHFTVGGRAQPNGQWISTSDPSSVDYIGRSWRGSQTLEVAVYDATTATWSPFSFFTATTTAAHHIQAAFIGTDGPNSGGMSSTAPAVAAATNLAMLQPILAGATLEVPSAYAGSVTFAGSTGTLLLDDSSSFTGAIAGMTGQDTLDFRDMNPATIKTPTYSGTSSSGTLTVSDGTHTANIALSGNYLGSSFVASSDCHGGTSVVNSLMAANHSWI